MPSFVIILAAIASTATLGLTIAQAVQLYDKNDFDNTHVPEISIAIAVFNFISGGGAGASAYLSEDGRLFSSVLTMMMSTVAVLLQIVVVSYISNYTQFNVSDALSGIVYSVFALQQFTIATYFVVARSDTSWAAAQATISA